MPGYCRPSKKKESESIAMPTVEKRTMGGIMENSERPERGGRRKFWLSSTRLGLESKGETNTNSRVQGGGGPLGLGREEGNASENCQGPAGLEGKLKREIKPETRM